MPLPPPPPPSPQEKGLDTVDANRALGLPDDCREYSAVAHILSDLGVSSVRLMTNNPRKLSEMAALGVAVTGRIPCQARTRRRRLAARLHAVLLALLACVPARPRVCFGVAGCRLALMPHHSS